MLEQLDTLEAKLTQLMAHYRALREESQHLRQRILAMENANRQLSDRLTAASSRMEALFEQLP
jgi:predicted  nucleic acid-binding Zn-ribbon protein